MSTPAPHRRRLDLAAPLADTPDTDTDDGMPTPAERLLVVCGLWVVPLFNTCLLTFVILLLLR